jgi:hypothetical protein
VIEFDTNKNSLSNPHNLRLDDNYKKDKDYLDHRKYDRYYEPLPID